MTDPLVLYRADPPTPEQKLDTEAAVRQLRERWPGAELEAQSEVPWTRQLGERPVWVLGFALKGEYGDGVISIDPTPDASIAMQAWRRLSGGLDCDRCEHAPRETCEERCTPTVRMDDDAPTWLRYLDDAVCGRWEELGSRDVWAAVLSYSPESAVARLAVSDASMLMDLRTEGRAILRARERWKSEITPALDQIAKLCDCPEWDYPGQLVRDVEDLCAERDGLRTDAERLRHRLTFLREDTCSPHWMGSAHQVVADLCELAGVG